MVCVLAALAYVVVGTLALQFADYDVAGSLLIGPVLLLASWAMIVHIGRVEPDRRIRLILTCSLVGFYVAALAHHHVAFQTYGEVSDAVLYSREGEAIAAQLRTGNLAVVFDVPFVGLGFTYLLTGLVYTLIGPSTSAAFLVFAAVGFWGVYLWIRAFRTALPEGDHLRYALLVALFPSILFWSGGIGKEPWMMLCLGAAALGAARVLAGTRRGIPLLLFGLAGSALIRPHMTAIAFGALAVALMVRRSRRSTPLTPVTRVLLIGGLVAVGAAVLARALDFLRENGTSSAELDAILADSARRSGGGGSAFAVQAVQGIGDLPAAVITVLVRPFPWEASGLALISAVEGTVLLVLLVTSWRSYVRLPGLLRTRPYVLLCLVYTLGFVVAFSGVSNFGGLVRERVMVLPFLIALLCLPRPRPAPREGE